MNSPTEQIDILLVEDNPGDVRLIRESFAESEVDSTFTAVEDGRDAIEFLRDCRETESTDFPDLVLLDLNLPRMDGFAFLDALRDDPDFPPLPVLVLTSSSAEEDVVKCYEHAANAYLTKPNDPNEFGSLADAVQEFWGVRARLPPAPA